MSSTGIKHIILMIDCYKYVKHWNSIKKMHVIPMIWRSGYFYFVFNSKIYSKVT